MASAEASSDQAAPAGGLAQIFLAADAGIERRRTGNIFKQLDERSLTEEEERIIQQRVELQRRLLQEYEKREQARKVKELQDLWPELSVSAAQRALELCHGKEDDAVLRLTEDAGFRRRVMAETGTFTPTTVVVVAPRASSSSRGASSSSSSRLRGDRHGSGSGSRVISPSKLDGNVFVGRFRSKLGPYQERAIAGAAAQAAAGQPAPKKRGRPKKQRPDAAAAAAAAASGHGSSSLSRAAVLAATAAVAATAAGASQQQEHARQRSSSPFAAEGNEGQQEQHEAGALSASGGLPVIDAAEAAAAPVPVPATDREESPAAAEMAAAAAEPATTTNTAATDGYETDGVVQQQQQQQEEEELPPDQQPQVPDSQAAAAERVISMMARQVVKLEPLLAAGRLSDFEVRRPGSSGAVLELLAAEHGPQVAGPIATAWEVLLEEQKWKEAEELAAYQASRAAAAAAPAPAPLAAAAAARPRQYRKHHYHQQQQQQQWEQQQHQPQWEQQQQQVCGFSADYLALGAGDIHPGALVLPSDADVAAALEAAALLAAPAAAAAPLPAPAAAAGAETQPGQQLQLQQQAQPGALDVWPMGLDSCMAAVAPAAANQQQQPQEHFLLLAEQQLQQQPMLLSVEQQLVLQEQQTVCLPTDSTLQQQHQQQQQQQQSSQTIAPSDLATAGAAAAVVSGTAAAAAAAAAAAMGSGAAAGGGEMSDASTVSERLRHLSSSSHLAEAAAGGGLDMSAAAAAAGAGLLMDTAELDPAAAAAMPVPLPVAEPLLRRGARRAASRSVAAATAAAAAADGDGSGGGRAGGRASAGRTSSGALRSSRAISETGHTCRGRVRQKSHKTTELVQVGELVARPEWFNAGYIFPAGFKSRLLFRSSVDLDALTLHECEIVGEGGRYWPAPTFVVTARDREDEPIVAKSCTGCWSGILKRINAVISRRIAAGEALPPPPRTAIAGPEYFGLNDVTTAGAIEALDPQRLCTTYWLGKQQREAAAAGMPIAVQPRGGSGAAAGAAAAAGGGGRKRGRPRGGLAAGAGGAAGGEADADDEGSGYRGARWSSISRRERYIKRCTEAGDAPPLGEEAELLPGFLDPITLEPVVNPAISPAGHVMGLATWKAVLSEAPRCPFTKAPLRPDMLTVLSAANIEKHRHRIVAMT